MMKQISLVDNDEPQEEVSDEDDLGSQIDDVMMQFEQASNKSNNSKTFLEQQREEDMVVLTKITEEDGYLPTVLQTEEDVIENGPQTEPI